MFLCTPPPNFVEWNSPTTSAKTPIRGKPSSNSLVHKERQGNVADNTPFDAAVLAKSYLKPRLLPKVAGHVTEAPVPADFECPMAHGHLCKIHVGLIEGQQDCECSRSCTRKRAASCCHPEMKLSNGNVRRIISRSHNIGVPAIYP